MAKFEELNLSEEELKEKFCIVKTDKAVNCVLCGDETNYVASGNVPYPYCSPDCAYEWWIYDGTLEEEYGIISNFIFTEKIDELKSKLKVGMWATRSTNIDSDMYQIESQEQIDKIIKDTIERDIPFYTIAPTKDNLSEYAAICSELHQKELNRIRQRRINEIRTRERENTSEQFHDLEDIPILLAEIDRLTAENKRLTEQLPGTSVLDSERLLEGLRRYNGTPEETQNNIISTFDYPERIDELKLKIKVGMWATRCCERDTYQIKSQEQIDKIIEDTIEDESPYYFISTSWDNLFTYFTEGNM